MWERFKWLLITTFKFKRTAYPRTLWGTKLCLLAVGAGMFSVGSVNIQFESEFIVNTLDLDYKEPSLYSMYLSTLLFFVGCALIFSEWNQKLRHTAKVMISAMPGVPTHFPDEILEPTEKAFCRESVFVGLQQPATENISAQIRRYNAELEVDVFKQFILHEKGQKLYIGGLARVPFLVSYGAMLRNLTAEIAYFDKFHRGGNYSLLSEEHTRIDFTKSKQQKNVNQFGDTGIAVGFTTPILERQLPEELREFTTIMSPNRGNERNLIKSQENLHDLSEKLGKCIDQLSALPNCRKIHLFLSVQAAFAIEIGRRYQEGIHQKWVIHNFDPQTQSYTWAIELSKNGISKY